MANEAFQYGFGLGFDRAKEQRQHDQEDRQNQIHDLVSQREELVKKLPSLQQGTPEYDQAHTALQGVIGGIQDFYNQQKNPDAIQRFGHVLTDHLGITKPQATATMVNPKAKGLVEAGNISIWDRPLVQNGDGSHSSEYSTSFQDEQGREVIVPTIVNGKFLTPDGKKPEPGSPEEQSMFKAAWDNYVKTGQHLGKFATTEDANKYAQALHSRDKTPKNIAEQQARKAGVVQATDRAIAAAPLNLSQQAVQEALAKSAAATAGFKADLQAFHTLNPNATPEETSARESELNEKYFGQAGKGNWAPVAGTIDGNPANLLYNKNTHQYLTQGGSPVPPEIAEKFVPDKKESAATENIDAYKEYVAKETKEGRTPLPFPAFMAQQRREGAPLASMKYYNDYAVSHGFSGGWNDIPAQYRKDVDDYAIRKQALDKAYPVSTTVTSRQLDAEGQLRLVTVTNYKTPQGTETLKDPLWFLAPKAPSPNDGVQRTPDQTAAPSSSSPAGTTKPAKKSGAPPSLQDLKKEADARNPKKTTTNAKPDDGSMKVGGATISAALLPAKNKEYDDAKSAYDGARQRVETMDKAAVKAYKGDQQSMLSLIANHIGMTLGAQKGARINQAVWNEAVSSAPYLEQFLSKIGHFGQDGYWYLDTPFLGMKGGVTLTGEQIKSMVELAHDQAATFKDTRDRVRKRVYAGTAVAPPSDDDDDTAKKPIVPKGATHKVPYQGKWYYADKDGNNLGEVK